MVRTAYARGVAAEAVAAQLGVTTNAVRNRARIVGQLHRDMTRTVEQRFWDYVSCEPNSGCWLWEGSQDRKGYGQLRLGLRSLRYATHIALELDGRPVPRGKCACHTCDLPSCVNPAHLFIGTPKQNTSDMVSKGRGSPPPIRKGSKNNQAKLHEQDVRAIRERLAGGQTLKTLATEYGVTESAISYIRLRKTWRHVG